jgi:hypothetical protein
MRHSGYPSRQPRGSAGDSSLVTKESSAQQLFDFGAPACEITTAPPTSDGPEARFALRFAAAVEGESSYMVN